jgi:hypothetical protein
MRSQTRSPARGSHFDIVRERLALTGVRAREARFELVGID